MRRVKVDTTAVQVLESDDPTLLVDTRSPCGVGYEDRDALHMCVDDAGNVCLLIEEGGELLPHEIVLSGETFKSLASVILHNLENVQ